MPKAILDEFLHVTENGVNSNCMQSIGSLPAANNCIYIWLNIHVFTAFAVDAKPWFEQQRKISNMEEHKKKALEIIF